MWTITPHLAHFSQPPHKPPSLLSVQCTHAQHCRKMRAPTKKKMSSANQPAHTQTQPRLCCTNTTPRDHEPLTLSLSKVSSFSQIQRENTHKLKRAETPSTSSHRGREHFSFFSSGKVTTTLLHFSRVYLCEMLYFLSLAKPRQN